MTRRTTLALVFLSLAASAGNPPGGGTPGWNLNPSAPPAIITEPDCPNPFMMDTHHRHNPEELGSLTRDGYPVMLTPSGESRYVMPHGMKLPDPVILPGYAHPDSTGER